MATTTAPTKARGGGDRWAGPGMLLPFSLFYLIFLVGPLIYTVVAGFFDTSLLKSGLGDFAGLSNYSAVLGDSEFWRTLRNTLWFTVLTTVPLVLLSLVLAILADRFVRGRWFF